MNITQTIKDVSKKHSMPIKNGTYNWFLYHPFDITKGDATTQSSASGSYQKALRSRKGYITYDVAILCGVSVEDATHAMYEVEEKGMTIYNAVKNVLECV